MLEPYRRVAALQISFIIIIITIITIIITIIIIRVSGADCVH